MSERQRFRVTGLRRRQSPSGGEVLAGGLTLARLEDLVREAKHWGFPLVRLVIFKPTATPTSKDPDLVAYLEPRLIGERDGDDGGEA